MQVKVHDYLKAKVKACPLPENGVVDVSLPDRADAGMLVRVMGLEPEWVGLIVVNGRRVHHRVLLSHCDLVELFAPLSGG